MKQGQQKGTINRRSLLLGAAAGFVAIVGGCALLRPTPKPLAQGEVIPWDETFG